MTAASATEFEKAKSGADEVVGRKAQAVGAYRRVMQKLQDTFTLKPNANIAARAGHTVRAAEAWTSENEAARRDMNVFAFIALLQSDVGELVLKEVMEALPKRERPKWWIRHSNMARLVVIEAAHAAAESEIKQLRLEMGEGAATRK